jgi:hypothetical protein
MSEEEHQLEAEEALPDYEGAVALEANEELPDDEGYLASPPAAVAAAVEEDKPPPRIRIKVVAADAVVPGSNIKTKSKNAGMVVVPKKAVKVKTQAKHPKHSSSLAAVVGEEAAVAQVVTKKKRNNSLAAEPVVVVPMVVTRKKPGPKPKNHGVWATTASVSTNKTDWLASKSVPPPTMAAALEARQRLQRTITKLPCVVPSLASKPEETATSWFSLRSLGQLVLQPDMEKQSTAYIPHPARLHPVNACVDRYEFSPVHGRVLRLRCTILHWATVQQLQQQMGVPVHPQPPDGPNCPLFRISWGRGIDDDADYYCKPATAATPATAETATWNAHTRAFPHEPLSPLLTLNSGRVVRNSAIRRQPQPPVGTKICNINAKQDLHGVTDDDDDEADTAAALVAYVPPVRWYQPQPPDTSLWSVVAAPAGKLVPAKGMRVRVRFEGPDEFYPGTIVRAFRKDEAGKKASFLKIKYDHGGTEVVAYPDDDVQIMIPCKLKMHQCCLRAL